MPSPGNAGSFEAGGAGALAYFKAPHDAALAFILLYHLTQIIPGLIGGVLILALEGETVFGKRPTLAQDLAASAGDALSPAPASRRS